MRSRQTDHQPGQKIRSDGRDHAQTQPRQRPVACGTAEIGQFIHRSKYGTGPINEVAAKGGRSNLTRGPLEQVGAEAGLQVAQLHRQGGLRDGAGGGGPPEMPVASQRIDISQLTQGKVIHKNRLSH